jgi:hypothetical protein
MSTLALPNSDPTNETPPRSKRWIPISARMFAVYMLILALVSALYIGIPACRQRTSVRVIERGGSVNMRPVGPRWVQKLIGDDWNNLFGKPYEVVLWDDCVDDAFLAHLIPLTRLERLGIDGPEVTDAGPANLVGMTELRGLFIPDTNVTDAGLVYVKRLSNLRMLNLTGTKVSSAGLRHLVDLHKLEYVELDRKQITDADIAELKRALPKLAIVVDDEYIDDFHSPNPAWP